MLSEILYSNRKDNHIFLILYTKIIYIDIYKVVPFETVRGV